MFLSQMVSSQRNRRHRSHDLSAFPHENTVSMYKAILIKYCTCEETAQSYTVSKQHWKQDQNENEIATKEQQKKKANQATKIWQTWQPKQCKYQKVRQRKKSNEKSPICLKNVRKLTKMPCCSHFFFGGLRGRGLTG